MHFRFLSNEYRFTAYLRITRYLYKTGPTDITVEYQKLFTYLRCSSVLYSAVASSVMALAIAMASQKATTQF
jgi:hypothetical protein